MTKSITDITDTLFYGDSDLTAESTQTMISDALQGCDEGDLYLEHTESEYISRDDGRIKSAAYDRLHGFGLRGIHGEFACLSHSSTLNKANLKNAASSIRQSMHGYNGSCDLHPLIHPKGGAKQLYNPDNPLLDYDFEAKLALLGQIDAYARAADAAVRQVSCSLSGEWSAIQILRPDQDRIADIRPLVRLDISITIEENGIMENAFCAWGGRTSYDDFFRDDSWRAAVDKTIRQAKVKITAKPAPAGTMDVVTGPGWTGVLLHEAIGHGLEADFHAKGSSVFNGMIGRDIANEHVTVVDDATVHSRRGSLSYDDEGTPAQNTTLIENGKLVGLMTDRQSARLTGLPLTGNGRRESYRSKVMPRMTNTVMQNGPHSRAEMIENVQDGIYAADFGGGQVDITSGQFVFEVSEAYRIRNGKIEEPVKGATLIGKGADALKQIKMVGNDSELDNGIGICGKDGQSVPVGVGQPSLWIQGVTVGGSEV